VLDPRTPSSVAAVPEASHLTGRKPMETPETYLPASPTTVPALLMAWTRASAKPEASVPRLPSSIAIAPEASHLTARPPRLTPETYLFVVPAMVPNR
jgi:hypothetical protein